MLARRNSVERRGFTLLELMLVLALMVALAGLAWPSINTMFDSQRLYKAADQMRAAWMSARNSALTNGRTMLFRFTPQSDRYVVEVWQGDAAAVQTDVETDPAATAGPTTTARELHLPEGITFVDSSTQADSRSDMVASTHAGVQDMALAPPIVFYPDGTTSTAELQLANTHGLHLAVQLRGLTGTTLISEVTKEAISEITETP